MIAQPPLFMLMLILLPGITQFQCGKVLTKLEPQLTVNSFIIILTTHPNNMSSNSDKNNWHYLPPPFFFEASSAIYFFIDV